MSRVQALLGELLPDMQRGAITRKGREWLADVATWRTALESVFESNEKGTLKTPLDGNGYLYEVVMRTVDRFEARAERLADDVRKHRPSTSQEAAEPATACMPEAIPPTPPPPPGPSPYAQKVRAPHRSRKAGPRRRRPAHSRRPTESHTMTAEDTTTERTVPKGYWEDANGAQIPLAKVKDIDKARHKLVSELALQARQMSEALRDFKLDVMGKVAAPSSSSAPTRVRGQPRRQEGQRHARELRRQVQDPARHRRDAGLRRTPAGGQGAGR